MYEVSIKCEPLSENTVFYSSLLVGIKRRRKQRNKSDEMSDVSSRWTALVM